MIIENQAGVTDAVIEAFGRTEDPRLREILLALVKHLHGFVRETRLTEREFQEATRIIAALGQNTTPSHNEVVLMAGSLGVSALVCLLNNGDNGQTETQANLLGPFWRDDQPLSESGVTRALIGDYVRHDEPSAEHGFAAPWYSLDQQFVIEPGEARRPAAPIRSKAGA